jgi:hypothetical protein
MFDILSYLEKGYYVGKNRDIVTDIDVFNSTVKSLQDISLVKEDNYVFVHSVNDVYVDGVKLNILKPGPLKPEDVPERLEYVKKYNADVFQRYWLFNESKGQILEKYKSYFRKIVESFLPTIYPELKDNFIHRDAITMFTKSDYQTSHRDGMNEGRKCVILIYLSDPSKYISGGELNVKEDGLHVVIAPTSENFCLLDCTMHNLNHYVSEVVDDFQRLAYVNFVYTKEN